MMEFYKFFLIAVGLISVLLGFCWFMDWLKCDAPEWVKEMLSFVGTSLVFAFFIWILTR